MEIKTNKIKNIQLDCIRFLSFNRNVNDRQVNKLLNSMSEHGKLRLPVLVKTKAITGNEEYYCVDGQHMITALKKNQELDVRAIVFETDSLSEIVEVMAILNNVVQKWSIKDYVDAYASLAKPDYLVLKRIQKETGFPFKICSHILGNSGLVKKGEFVCNKTDAHNIIKYATDVVTIINSSKAHMLVGFVRFLRNDSNFKYNHNKMIERLKKANKKLIGDASPETSFALFTQIYNS